jgi:4-diphosphocytidyl-2-C-methyl-D-erythritol kinase
MTSITLRAFAKINLSLRVSAAREDGFHDVQTLLQAIDLFDRVKCETRRGPFEIRCDMPGVPTDGRNLVWKAAKLLWDASGRAGEPQGAIVTLQKQIPMMAGLGGGSSDAAAALIGLRRLWKLRVGDAQVHALASRLGSDVPFFLLGGTALGLGRGDELYPLANLPRYWVVLAIPPFGIATPDAYRWLDEARQGGTTASRGPTGTMVPSLLPNVLFVNDLEAPVAAHHPVIDELKQRLADRGALLAAMSGSGSTVFGVFPSVSAARSATRAVASTGAKVLTARFFGAFTRRSR